MPDYDFKRLSHVDFEELIHDLLESEWDCRLEAFKTGRDNGIDLRYIACDGVRTIVQCKHYPNSSVSTLISKMKNEELPKIEALAPERYVLVTSAGLTPDNKKALADALHPYVVREDDIIGATEVEALLRANDAVVKTHYKLWLTSTAVMERVLHAAEHARTDIHLEKILRKLPLFVRHEAFPRALGALDDHRIVVISGGPGIGKSTLADMLLYSHVEGGFTPAVITDNLAEAHVLTRPGKKMLFYFDDFLGETYLGDRPDYLGRREDKALVDFVDYILNSEDHRFILTTREHIFLGALEQSERLRHSGIAEQKCLIELSDYPRAHRARMLYNHLYFSQLPDAYKAAILEDDFFLEIIEHENFNPRVIEWLSTFSRLKTVAVEDYAGHVIKVLDDPHEIWRHAFEQEISPAARNVMIVLHSLGGTVEIEDLQLAWAAFDAHCIAKYRYSSRPGAFRSALKELEGSFLTYGRDQAHFLNPSVRDFMASIFEKSGETVLDVISTAVRFRQLAELWTAARDADKYPGLRQLLDRHAEAIEDKYRALAANNTFRMARRNGRSAARYIDLGWWVRDKAQQQTGQIYSYISIQEAGLDGFWIHRLLESQGIESHIVDPASVATSRRRRRAKTDKLDGEILLRTLLAYKRGDPRICAMARVPTPEEEDRRRVSRERRVLINERVSVTNRLKGLLFCHGITGFEPAKQDRWERFAELRAKDGNPLSPHIKAELERMLERIDLIQNQVKAVEVARDELIVSDNREQAPGAAMLLRLKGVGPDFAETIWSECLYRHFDNRRQLAAYAGLAPTPWQSGSISREQGVSQSGNPRLRMIMVQLAWFWLLHQPDSALTKWFRERTKIDSRRQTIIIALARKLLIALWKFARFGEVIEGAVMKNPSARCAKLLSVEEDRPRQRQAGKPTPPLVRHTVEERLVLSA